jgi:ADP-heptose:LPS heptosyltransferase
MSTPAMRALRESGMRLTLLASAAGAQIAALIPELEETIVYQAPWVKGENHRHQNDLAVLQLLQKQRFDAAVIFTTYTQSALPAALLCSMAAIPLRLAHSRENPYDLLSDWVPDPEPSGGIRHEVQRQLDLVGTIGATTSNTRLSIRLPAPTGKQRCVAIHPGATAPSRRYAPARFAAAADLIAQRTGYPILLIGGAADTEVVLEIEASMRSPATCVTGIDVAELAGLLARASLVVANNSGPAHLAAAVGTPVVDLYALTNPQHTPWGVPHRVLFHDVPCRNCLRSVCPLGHNACLQEVSPQEVADAVCELLS